MGVDILASAVIPSRWLAAIRELAELPQWICWMNLNGLTIPRAVAGFNASTTTKNATWGSFDECTQGVVSNVFTGLGFVFSSEDDYVGVSFNYVLDADFKIKDPLSAKWVAELNSYTEISPSGEGLKVFMRGAIPSTVSTAFVEMYDHGRYCTVTGRHYEGTPESINWSKDALVALYKAVKIPRATEPIQSDEGAENPPGMG